MFVSMKRSPSPRPSPPVGAREKISRAVANFRAFAFTGASEKTLSEPLILTFAPIGGEGARRADEVAGRLDSKAQTKAGRWQ
jgi:hypothetical protein